MSHGFVELEPVFVRPSKSYQNVLEFCRGPKSFVKDPTKLTLLASLKSHSDMYETDLLAKLSC